MDNNQEQLHNNPNNQDNTFPEEFEMKWGTDDLPKGMKRRGSQHHNSHSESHHSTHSHHKSSSHHRKTNRRMDEGEKRSFQDLIYREQARKKETTSSQSVQEEPGVSEKTGSGKPNAVMNVVREEKPVSEMKVSDTADSPASNDGHTRIEEEKIVRANGRLYTVLRAAPGTEPLTSRQCFLGPRLMQHCRYKRFGRTGIEYSDGSRTGI